MRLILSLTLVILVIQPALALGYSEHILYLSKIIVPVTRQVSDFSDIDLSANPDLLSWLKDLDAKLNPCYLGTYDADLLLNFAADGHIAAISVNVLREQNLDKFKSFIAKLQTLQAQPLPAEISLETVFKLNARMLYIERSESYLGKLNAESSKLNVQENPGFNIAELLNYFQANSEIKVELLEPGYIDYPRIGEALTFHLKDVQYKGLKLYANVISLEDKAMLVKLNRVGDKLIDLVFRIDRPSKDSRSTLATVINSGLGSAMGAGITASLASNGIIPGVLALTNMTGTLMKERGELLSFNLVKGDEVVLVNKGKRGEQ